MTNMPISPRLVPVGGTDGRDGPTDAAGALVGPMGGGDMASARAALAAHDCYPYLEARDELLMVPPISAVHSASPSPSSARASAKATPIS